jgi:hypothetical protein
MMKYNDSISKTVTVSNNTGVPLDVGQITIADTAGKKDSSSFEIAADNASNKTIAVGDSASVKIFFNPLDKGAKFAYLNIPTNNDLRPNAVLSLYGSDSVGPNRPVPKAPLFSTDASSTNSFSLSWYATQSSSTTISYQLKYTFYTISKQPTTAWYTNKIDGQEWTNKTKTTFAGKPGYTYEFYITAKDKAGNISARTYKTTLVPFDERSLSYSSNWKSTTSSYAYKSTLKYTTVTNSYATFALTYYDRYGGWNDTVALIAPMGPYKGKMNVYARDKVDGVWTKYVKVTSSQYPVDLYSSTYKNRKLIYLDMGWDKNWSSTATHQLKFVATGTKNRLSKGTRIDIDGLIMHQPNVRPR